jgi:hypothetical protein
MIRRLHVPVLKPEDVIPHLAQQELHWKTGYSAKELAGTWWNANNDFPASVRAVLNTAPEYKNAKLVDGFFEHEVELRSPGRNSQTDLMVIADLGDELSILAVEGKVEEPFAKVVSKWNGSPGKQTRLKSLCRTLGLDPANVGHLRYQLFHRTASAIYEARRYHFRHAMMLVHSFSPTHHWFEDLAAFSRALSIPVDHPGLCSAAKEYEGVSLRLAWVADTLQCPPEVASADLQ